MPERIVPNNGIADERVFWSASYSTVVWNQQTPFPAPRVNTFTRPSMRVELNNFPGSNGFLSSLNDVLVDAHGLTDGFLARIPFTAVGGTFRPGHLLRQVPPGYLDSVRFRAPKMLDDKLNEAYSLYELAVSGPLFSYERIKAAILLALGTTKENMHSFVEHPITVKQSWFTPVRRGTKWDNAAAIQLGSNGVLVLLDEVKLQKSIAFYADHNDRLRVKFGESDHETQVKIVEEVVSDPPYGGGLQPRNIIRTSATSFNCFLVVIDGDDSLSSIAYVTL